MTDASDKAGISRPDTDPTAQVKRAPGTDGHHSGEEADATPQAAPQKTLVGATDGGVPAPDAGSAPQNGRDIPPDAGQRAWVDQKTGEVHGSGAGAGGGNPGEDFDPDTPGGGDNEQAAGRP